MEAGLPDIKGPYAESGVKLHAATWCDALKATITDSADLEAIENIREGLASFNIQRWEVETQIACHDFQENEFDPALLFFGTPDGVGFIDEETALIAELKYGWHPVDHPKDNIQTGSCAVALKQKYPKLKRIFGAILQPRCSPEPKIYEYTDFDSIFNYVKSIITNSMDEILELNAGEDQCKYCRAQFICPKVRKEQAEIEKLDDFSLITVDNAADMYDKIKVVRKKMDGMVSRIKELLEYNDGRLKGIYIKRSEGRRTVANLQEAYDAVKDYFTVPEFLSMCNIKIGAFETAVARKLMAAGHVKNLKEGRVMFAENVPVERCTPSAEIKQTKI